jgi:hypothetical protein
MTLPDGNIPGITNVRYAGMVPYRNGVTNPPITTPQFPNNAPRATNKSPIALHPVVDNLTLTRPTHTMLGSIPAGGYRGAVGQVVRSTDQNVGAGLRGVMVSGRLGSHAPQGYRGYASFNGLGGPTAGDAGYTAPRAIVVDAAVTIKCGLQAPSIDRVASFRVTSGENLISCHTTAGTLWIRGLIGEGAASVTYSLTATPLVDHTLAITVSKGEGLTGEDALQAGLETVAEVGAILEQASGKPAPDIDWQDAEILRGVAKPLIDSYAKLRRAFGIKFRARGDLTQMIEILQCAQTHPELQTLNAVLVRYHSDQNTSMSLVLNQVGSGPTRPYNRAQNFSAYQGGVEAVMAVVAVVVQVVGSILATVYPAFAPLIMAVVAIVGKVAQALRGFNCQKMIQAFGMGIRVAALATTTESITPIRLQGNALVRANLMAAAGPLIVQAGAGYKGTSAQANAFTEAWGVAQRAGLQSGETLLTGLIPLPAYAKCLRDIKALRPDLCGLSSSLADTVVLLDGTMQSDPLYRAMQEYGAAASLIVLYFLFHNTPGAVIPATLLTSPKGGGGRITYIARLQRAHTAYLAAIAAAPKPLAEMYRAPMVRALTAVAMLGKGVNAPGTRVLPAHPEVLAAAGILTTEFPNGYGEFLIPLPAGQEARLLTTVDALMGTQIPPSNPTPPGPDVGAGAEDTDSTGPADNSGAGGGAGGGGGTDQPKASSNTPMLIGGAVVLGIGAFLLLRK